MLLLECVGIPGAGKSHIAGKLRTWLATSDISFVDVAEFLRTEGARPSTVVPGRGGKLDLGSKDADVLLKSFRRFLLEEPDYTLQYLQAIISLEPSRALRDLILSSFTYSCAQRGFFLARIKRLGVSLALHEEGLVHRLFTLFGYRLANPSDDRLLHALAEATPRPDFLIWVRCSPEIALQRLDNRKRKKPDRLKAVSAQEATEILANADRKIESAIRIMRKRGTRVAELRSDENLDEATLFEAFLGKLSNH